MNFLGMGPMELLLIVVLALIVFGPAKLPEIMGQVGKAINDFRRATTDLSDEFNKTIQAELQETRSVVDEARSVMTDARSAVTDVHSSVNAAVSGTPAPTRIAEPATASNGALSNGTTASESSPPLADTSQWSWETAATPEPKADAETTVAETTVAEATVAEATSDAASPAVSPADASGEPPAANKPTTARDELEPPY